jgi:heme ABC exporter ATP-binding subunit CcmA/heme exporter protein CcmB
LDGIDLAIDKGEFVALVGPNGAGKTTLLRILATLSRPSAGSVRIAGLDLGSEGEEARRRIGFLSHHTLLYDDLTAEQNLRFYARMYDMHRDSPRVSDLLERVGLGARRADLVQAFSRGMKQRLAVARAVLHRPQLLLLDEPYTGLDPQAVETLRDLLAELVDDGCTILLTTHLLDRALSSGERVLVLHHGHLVYDQLRGKVVPESFLETYRAITAYESPSRGEALSFLRKTLAIVDKDIIAELHTREVISAMVVFSALALLIFSFALDLRGEIAEAAAPGVLWTTIAFAGTLGLSRSMAREEQTGCIDGLLLTPVDRTAIFFGKAAGNLVFMAVVELILLPLFSVFFDVALMRPRVFLVLALGTVGYAAVGTLLAAIAVNTRAREVMLPVLLLPLAVPVLIGAVQATGGLLAGATVSEVNGWIRILVVYDLVIVAVSLLTFGYVVQE